jgi:stage II sporulation protein P
VRSDNINENVVGIGRKLVSVLSDFGIPSVHSEKMCDSESFVRAYSTSYAEAKNYLEKYPSIRFVIDLHRDAIELSDGTRKKPVSEAFGKKTAQLMFVVGTNEAGANHPLWKENLALALFLQNEIGKENPKLFRSTNLRTASFNQQLLTGYMLLECGSAANTLEEAENAAEIFAPGLARIIMKYAV